MNRKSTVRIRVLSVIIVLFGVFLMGRLYHVQVLFGEEFSHKADRQYVRPNHALFDRGDIFFTTKHGERVSAATLKTGYIVSINPTLLRDPQSTFDAVSKIIDVPAEEFFAKANKPDDPYEEIAQRVSQEVAEQIKELDITGLQVHRQRWRFYPGGGMASHALGLVAYSGDELAGRYGLERFYEQTLGRNESNVYVNFFAEIFSNIKETITYSQEREGSIVTSIEPSVQGYVEQILAEIQDEWNSDETGAIVIDPQTGRIIAMAALPSFDPNVLSDVEDVAVFTNPLVENVYEMGSIVKALTVAAGLDVDAVTPDSTYYDAGYLVLNNSRIQNFDGEGRGTVSMQEVLNQSLNTGVAHIVSRMGKENFAEYMYDFGLGEHTGIDLPNEAKGLVSNLQSPRDIEHATASYGQGIAITPMAMVRALSALANGGVLITPHTVTEVDFLKGLSKDIKYTDTPRVLKESTAEEISRMLTAVVDDALLDGSVKLDRYSIAAKTGTAQISSQQGGYYDDRFLHTFFGYFPSYDSRFLVFLFTKHPQGVRYASQTLTHPFMDITQFLINYYDIAPDR